MVQGQIPLDILDQAGDLHGYLRKLFQGEGG